MTPPDAETTANWPRVAKTEFPEEGATRVVAVSGCELLLVRQEGRVHAAENRCPHQNRSLAGAELEEGSVSCPHHGWLFGVPGSEESERQASKPVLRWLPTDEVEGGLRVDVSALLQSSETPAGSLIRYGRPGWVRAFATASDETFLHRSEVIVQTERGLEVGEVLGSAEVTAAGSETVVRSMTEEDRAATNSSARTDLLEEALRRAANTDLPWPVIDGEVLFDGQSVVLYHAGPPEAAFGPLAVRLAVGLPCRILFAPLSEPTAEGGGCGCSSGGCSN